MGHLTKTSGPGPLTLSDFRPSDIADERRKEQRIQGQRTIEIMRYVDSMAFEPAKLVDCSLHGVGLLAPWSMNLDERFVLKVELKRLTLVMYAVRNCREIGAGEFRVGAELCGFLASPEEENVELILQELLRN